MAAEHTTAIFAAQLILLLFFGRMLGEIMSRLGQPAIFGQLLAGVVLGPSIFGALLPESVSPGAALKLVRQVADSLQSVILNQVTNGVAVRMAVLYLLAGGKPELAEAAKADR